MECSLYARCTKLFNTYIPKACILKRTLIIREHMYLFLAWLFLKTSFFHLHCYKVEIIKKLVKELIMLLCSVYFYSWDDVSCHVRNYISDPMLPATPTYSTCLTCQAQAQSYIWIVPALNQIYLKPHWLRKKGFSPSQGWWPIQSPQVTWGLTAFSKTISSGCSYPFLPDLV